MLSKPTETFATGIFDDITNEQYHNSEGASSSTIKKYLEETPAKIEWDSTNKERKSNKEYDLGSAVHCLLLEPMNFERDFAVCGVWNLRTKDGRERKAAFTEENAGKTIIDIEQHERAIMMAESVTANPLAKTLLTNTVNEQSIYWRYEDPEAGIDQLLKVRPDALSKEHPLIIDVKTCACASWTEMQKAILNYKYHLSAAMYLEGVNHCKGVPELTGIDGYEGFVLVCVEKEPPFQVACYEISPEFLSLGRALFLDGLSKLQYAKERGALSYPSTLRMIDPPPWGSKVYKI